MGCATMRSDCDAPKEPTAVEAPGLEKAKAVLRDLVRLVMRLPVRGKSRLRGMSDRWLTPSGNIEFVKVGPYRVALDHRFIATRDMAYGCYEINELAFFKSLVRPSDVVFDVGANVGYFTAHFASFVLPGGLVYAFEPAPECRAYLEALLQSGPVGSIRYVPQAVSRESRTGVYYSTAQILNRGFGRIDRQPSERHVSTPHSVAIVSIDDFVMKERIDVERIRACKVDVEGEEMNVLLGMRETLNKGARPIVLTEFAVANDHDNLTEMADYMKTFGYTPHRLKGKTPTAVAIRDLPAGAHGNLVWMAG